MAYRNKCEGFLAENVFLLCFHKDKMILKILYYRNIFIFRNRQADAKNRALQSENSDLQRKVNQLERDLYEERQAAKAPRDAVSKLQSQMSAVDGKNEELQRRWGSK